MQEEKQNKQIRNTLDELQQLPEGFVFNNQKVWAGLEQQLPGKKNKKATWYYAAAVILLMAGAAYLLLVKNNNKEFVKETTVVNFRSEANPAVSPVILPKNILHTQVKAEAYITKKKPHQLIPAIPVAQKEINNDGIKIDPPAVAPAEQIVVITPPVQQSAPEEKKKIPAIAVSKPAPKKYKVIHLNELLQLPVAPDPQSTLSRSEFKKMMQQNEEKEIATPAENNTKQLFFFKIKPPVTSTISIVEN
ncbi:MAG: hypothetical protein JWQ30_2424 [Sediminibacterium sp.]|nr:hypothetical protein [Sediminibacterium sp.]